MTGSVKPRVSERRTLRLRVVRQVGRGTDERGSIVIVSGPAASGKSSAARLLAQEWSEPSVHLQGDDFFRALKVGRLRGWEDGAVRNTRSCSRRWRARRRRSRTAATSSYWTRSIRPRYLDILIDIIKTGDVELHYVVLRPSWSVVQTRSDRRDETWRHDPEVLSILYDVFRDLGEYESHVIDNSTLDERRTVAAINERFASGALLL